MQAPKKTTSLRDALRAKARLVIQAQAPPAVDQRAVDAGRAALPPLRKDAAAIKARFLELYAIPAEGLAAPATIDSGFKFAASPADADFHYLHVEELLEQASGLLERCATARAEYDRLQLEKWKLQVEADQFFRLDQIEQAERQAGRDTISYQRALLDGAAEKGVAEYYGTAEAQLKELMDDLLASGLNKRMAGRELTAWLASYPLKDRELTGDDALYSFDGARKSKPDHLFDAARLEADQDGWEQVYALMTQRYTAMAASEPGRLRRESLGLAADWSHADIAFRGQRSQAESDALWEKVFQAQAAGGALNYSEKIAAAQRRFNLDLRAAAARLTPAARGLQTLYDYAAPLPQPGSAGYFEGMLGWTAAAQTRLAQFSQWDQPYVLALSVKDLSKSQWESGRASSQWTFDLPEEAFQGQAHVRLRGVSIAVAGPKPEPEPATPAAPQKSQKPDAAPKPEPPKVSGFWSAHLTLPAVATVRNMAGASGDLDQSALPDCFCGRIAAVDAAQPLEVAGTAVFRNASPIGKQWKLALSPKSTGGTPTEKLEDVELYLHVAVRGVKAGSR